MKVVICGSRGITNLDIIDAAVKASGYNVKEVISGRAQGVDRLGERWARNKQLDVSYYPISKADWERHGRAAGPLRNTIMLNVSDAVLAIWDGESAGTWDMIRQCMRAGKKHFVYQVKL